MLTADQQRFLLRGYGYHSAAEALDGDWRTDSLKQSSRGGWHSDVRFDTNTKGIGYTWRGEESPGPSWSDHVHRITWAEMDAHRRAQPESYRQQLRDALDASASEHRRHWEAMNEINETWYWKATPEQRAQLDGEWERHLVADRANSAAVRVAVVAMLPLSDDEPADLIEWAQVLQ